MTKFYLVISEVTDGFHSRASTNKERVVIAHLQFFLESNSKWPQLILRNEMAVTKELCRHAKLKMHLKNYTFQCLKVSNIFYIF